MKKRFFFYILLFIAGSILLLSGCGAPSPPTTSFEATHTPTAVSPTFPPMPVPVNNPVTEAGVELGRQLFFDPILSRDGDMACSTCHHPDYGFSDGRTISFPREEAPGRNVSTLWNTGYNKFLLWDGRETALESQAEDPLTLPNEMNADPDALVARLAEIPAYVELFELAYDSEENPVNFENTLNALATFQRTLVAINTPYDQYIAGDTQALTAEQQQGMELFFSEETNCGACHPAPLFTTDTFRVTGVPSSDQGRAAVSESGIVGAFKAPSLRNVTRTAPYMHNGVMATLEDVVDFYAKGGGRPNGFAYVDPKVQGFEITEREKSALIAFLHALTDESAMPIIPSTALSGLPPGEPATLPTR